MEAAREQDIGAQQLILLMQKFNMNNIERENVIAELHPEVRKRVQALEKLQLETLQLDVEFNCAIYDLDVKFQSKHDEIFKKRSEILNGGYQPSDDECKLPGVEMKFDEPTEGQEQPKGVPHFWLAVLKSISEVRKWISEIDEEVLKHLVDIRAISTSAPDLSFTLEFHFEPNDFFKNSVLNKTYLMKCCLDATDPYAFEGPEIYKSVGCEIVWNAGKNVTELSPSSLPFFKGDSFFNFFNPPELNIEDSVDNPVKSERIAAFLESDFEIGHYMKERVIPRAVLFFTGDVDGSLPDDDDSIDFTDHYDDIDTEANELDCGDN